MGVKCCGCETISPTTKKIPVGYKRVLWSVLIINAAMFLAEIAAGILSGSASLQGDALDFLGDSFNYAISLLVIGYSLRARAKAALVKGLTMGLLGLWVIVITLWHIISGTLPEAQTMGMVGGIALIANVVSFLLLWRFRSGDANMHSAWICSRNDVIGNFAVLLAALGVFNIAKGWPDYAVAAIMAILALQGAWISIRMALGELRSLAKA
ncbi:cation efflux family protein [Zymomonas mobilis]|uniref:Cation efflux family protein n=1 Tax=Zymomonas mobilis TaxID=542 RepID=A0A542VZI8_ZYMMB|nr:cation efflux family protein [Zymomonas mobilis]